MAFCIEIRKFYSALRLWSVGALLLTSLSSYSFSGFEHLTLGDTVQYRFPKDSTKFGEQSFGRNYPYERELERIERALVYPPDIKRQYLMIPARDGLPDLKLSPGEIVAIAGDFVGNFEDTISQRGASWNHLKQRFMSAYDYMIPKSENWFWITTVLKDARLPRYREHFRRGLNHVIEAITAMKEQFPKESDRIGQLHLRMISGENTIDKIRDQAQIANDFYKYKELLSKNIDHFEEDGLQAYQAGHLVALEKAVAAKRLYAKNMHNEGRMILNESYAIEAFAQHFLSDAFSSGHMRTPRRGLMGLAKKRFGFSSADVGIMANAQHDETNWLGLYVENKAGDKWRAYGDNSYFDLRSKDNQKQITKALQASVDEVWAAFTNGIYPPPNGFAIEKYRPIPVQPTKNHFPLYAMMGKIYKMRANIHNYMESAYKKIQPGFMSSLLAWLKSPVDKYSSADFTTFQATGLAKNLTLGVKVKCYSKYFGPGLKGTFNKGKELAGQFEALYIPFSQLNFEQKDHTFNKKSKVYLFNKDSAKEIYDLCSQKLGDELVQIRAKASELDQVFGVLKAKIKITPFWLPAGLFDSDGKIFRLKGNRDGKDADYFQVNN